MSPLVARLSPLWHWRTIVGVVLGASLGALYAHFVGCPRGGCPITSSPLLLGAIGAYLGGSFAVPTKKPPAASPS